MTSNLLFHIIVGRGLNVQLQKTQLINK